jgi:cytochrome c553
MLRGRDREVPFSVLGWDADRSEGYLEMKAKVSVVLFLGVLIVSLPATARAVSLEDNIAMCGACHGENGVPQEKTTPIIWGQTEGYLYLQMRDYKRGDRKNDQMNPVAEQLERDEMFALAKYFSQKKWPNLGEPPAPADVAAQARRANGSVGCTGCHQDSYLGEGTQPRLAGQSKEYMLQTMLDFRSRARANNPGMSDLMKATSEDDIKAMAEYTAGL